MAQLERLAITLPADLAAAVKSAVASGDYESASEVVREALRDWKMKRALQMPEFAALRANIDKELADWAEGRMKDLKGSRTAEPGKKKPPPTRTRRR